jgi:hypothetical protein
MSESSTNSDRDRFSQLDSDSERGAERPDPGARGLRFVDLPLRRDAGHEVALVAVRPYHVRRGAIV